MWARVIAVLALTSTAASAAPVECAGIKADLDRLACYDKEVGRTPTPTPIASKGSWRVTSEKSVLTDKTDVFAGVTSTDSVDCGWNRRDNIRLLIRCMDNKTSLIIDTQCHMTSSDYNDYGHVTYRLDDTKAQVVSMVESTDNKTLGLWTGARSIPMIKQMLGKSKMIVKMTPYGQNPFTATFPIAGIDEALKPVREACKW